MRFPDFAEHNDLPNLLPQNLIQIFVPGPKAGVHFQSFALQDPPSHRTTMSRCKCSKRDRAAEQLTEWKEAHPVPQRATNLHGRPVPTVTASLTVGPRGPTLLEDVFLADHLSYFTSERIPERLVHAKGGGASGYFEVTHDITKYTKIRMFDTIGKKTPLRVRFSTVRGEAGSADTQRDPRGFGVKFYTEDGNWDLLGYNTPTFFIRDAYLMPSFTRSQHRNPVTHLHDPDQAWDFLTLRPESTHQVVFVYSDRGIPDGYRCMQGYACHTFKLINKDDECVYAKFHWKSNQGVRNLQGEEADRIAGEDPDHDIRDLYNAIADGNFPSWQFYVQIMTYEQAAKYPWNPFDLTKVWLFGDHPLIPVGKLVLDKNPKNYFNEIEQIAFSVSNMVPGIEASPDKMLQGRLFAYPSTQRHRLGANFPQLATNAPISQVRAYIRDGPGCQAQNDEDGGPNYFPNSFNGPIVDPNAIVPKYNLHADVERVDSVDEDNFSQVTLFWERVLSPEHRKRLVKNLVKDIGMCSKFIQERAARNFTAVHPDFGKMFRDALGLCHPPPVQKGEVFKIY